MDQTFDVDKVTSDLKQMLNLSQTQHQNISTASKSEVSNSLSQISTKEPSDTTTNLKNTEMDLDVPVSTSSNKKVSDTTGSPAKSISDKSRKKKQKSEKQVTKGQGKSSNSSPASMPSPQPETKYAKTQAIKYNPSPAKSTPLLQQNRNNANSGSSSSQRPNNMTNQAAEDNESDNSGTTKNQWDGLSRELQIKMDDNKIFFLKKKNMRFPNAKYFCRLCEYHMDTVEICEKHMEEGKHCHKKEVGSMDSTLRQLPPPASDHIVAITDAIDLVYEEYGIKPSDRDDRRSIVQRLEDTIRTEIPDLRLYMYGSSLTCMGLKTSDINVNLTSTARDKKLTTILRESYTLLKDRTDTGFTNIHSDFSATVPALLLTDEATGYTLTITIHVYSSLCTSELLAIYSDFDERTIKLAIALRYWAFLSGVDRHSIGFIPPIAFNIMVVFFLQTVKPQVLPIISPPAVAAEDSGDFSKDKPVFQLKRNKAMKVKPDLKNDMSVGELWVRLLKFYTIELDIPNVVISIRTPNSIPRKNKPWNSRKLAVEDPFMMKNLTRMLSSSYEYWQYTIRMAYHYFGLPRGHDGKSYLPEYNFPDECTNKFPIKKSAEEENILDKKKDDCLPKIGASSPPHDINKDTVVSENHTDALKSTHISSKTENETVVENSETIVDTCITKTCISSHSDSSPYSQQQSPDKASSSADTPETIVDNEIEHSISIRSFVLDYVNVIVEKALDIVSQEKSTSLSSPSSSHIADPQRDHTDRDSGVGNENDTSEKDKSSAENKDTINEHCPVVAKKDSSRCMFEFTKQYFTNKREPAIICVACEKEGHHKNECPEDVLPEILPIQGFKEHHHKVLEETLKKIPSEVGLSEVSYKERQMFLSCLEEFIQVGFPGARLQLFGSSCNGFGFDRSDMDICMTFVKKRPNIDKVFAVERLANILGVHKDLKNVQAISTAKVPIVKFTIKNIELDGDISLYNTLAQENTHLLYSYSKIDPRVQVLGYTIKMFAQVCDIGDASRGSLSSYGYVLMMLYYLQQVQPPVIPVLQELYTHKTKPRKMVECWDAWFMDDLSRLPKLWPEMGKNTMSVAELWLGFLRFYVEEFNYRDLVISIRQKEPLTRFDKLWNGFCLAIEDPFDLNHNLGSGLTRTMNNFILKTFINGRMLYGSPIDDNMELFNKYQTSADYFFDTELLSEARPPTLRGCRHCGKIGHLMRHCPVYKKEKGEEPHKEQQQRNSHDKQRQQRWPQQNQDGQRQSQNQQQRHQQRPQHQRQQYDHHHQHHQQQQQPGRNAMENQGQYSQTPDQNQSPRQIKPQQKTYSFQQQKQQEAQQLQKMLERDLYGERLQGTEPYESNHQRSPRQGHNHYNQPQFHMANPHRPPFPVRPTTVSPAVVQRHPLPDLRNAPPPPHPRHQYPPSLRAPRVVPNNQQYPYYGTTPPQGQVPPFYISFNNTNNNNNNNSNPRGDSRNNNINNPNNASSNRVVTMMPPPQNFMNMPTTASSASAVTRSAGHPPPLLPHPGASNTHGMSPVVQNLFASAHGKVLDARMIHPSQHPNQMKKN